MKQNWTDTELTESWTLSSVEVKLLDGMKRKNRLAFAFMLKFYQLYDRFPVYTEMIPSAVLAHLAMQTGSDASTFRKCDLVGRTSKRNREDIRFFLGVRKNTMKDSEDLISWLQRTILPEGKWSEDYLVTICNGYLREHKIEPIRPDRLVRNIRSALSRYEKRLFGSIVSVLTPECIALLDALAEENNEGNSDRIMLGDLRCGCDGINLKSILHEVEKCRKIHELKLPSDLLDCISSPLLSRYSGRSGAEPPGEIRKHPAITRYALLAIHCHVRGREITDNLVDLLIRLVDKIEQNAEGRADRKYLATAKKVQDKSTLLYLVSQAAVENPDKTIREIIFPIVSEEMLHEIIKEYRRTGSYREQVRAGICSSYGVHYRRMLSPILKTLSFHAGNDRCRPVTDALGVISEYANSGKSFFPVDTDIPLDGVVDDPEWNRFVTGGDRNDRRVRRTVYEIAVLRTLCRHLDCRDIWVDGGGRYRDPDKNLPQDFEKKREEYCLKLGKPGNADEFVDDLKKAMRLNLGILDRGLPFNGKVKIQKKKKVRIVVTPLGRQEEPQNIAQLKKEVFSRWPETVLLDVLKETDFRIGLCPLFESTASRQYLSGDDFKRRLLLCLFAYGTNAGFRSVISGNPGISYQDLRYVRRRFLREENVRDAIIRVVNAIFSVRRVDIWGEATTACAGDSIKFGSWDQNLLTEWAVRNPGPAVKVYWHVEGKYVCVHSQLKRCSSSEVSAMITGVLNHCTEMAMKSGYTDTHGQSLIGFAFSYMLGFDLLPRIKAINRLKLILPDRTQEYKNLKLVTKGIVKWNLIRDNYEGILIYSTAVRTGMADPESILKRFTGNNDRHPVYLALLELGKVVRTIFLCRYLHSEELRREIHEGLNVVECWNSVNSFIYYGKNGEIATNRSEEQEMSMLCLHLLQLCLVYVNTIMIQTVLSRPEWKNRLTDEDRRALCPLLFEHINPYGRFPLDMATRLVIDEAA